MYAVIGAKVTITAADMRRAPAQKTGGRSNIGQSFLAPPHIHTHYVPIRKYEYSWKTNLIYCAYKLFFPSTISLILMAHSLLSCTSIGNFVAFSGR